MVSVHEKGFCQSGDAANSDSFQANFHSLQDTTEFGGTSVTKSPEAGCSVDNGSGLYEENTKNVMYGHFMVFFASDLVMFLEVFKSVFENLVFCLEYHAMMFWDQFSIWIQPFEQVMMLHY